MRMINLERVFRLFLCMSTLSLFASCIEKVKQEPALVINELMASSKTGIPVDGKQYDWIEIRNVSNNTVNLADYALSKDSGKVTFELPDTLVQPEQCVVVYITKKNLDNCITCATKLSKKNDTIQIVTDKGSVISEVSYKKLKADQVIMRTEDGKYVKSYAATPGFPNNDEGRQEYLATLDNHRCGALRIWEYMNRNGSAALAQSANSYTWVEVKNVSDTAVDLSSYTLCSDTLKIKLPKQTLAPGDIILVEDTGKKLSGESVILEKDGSFVDGICAGETYFNISIGRVKDKEGLFFFESPTPGAENLAKAFARITEKPEFTKKGGLFEKDSLYVGFRKDGATIHYTIDGSIPTLESPVYNDSILLTASTVLRAFAVDSVNLRSRMVTATYLMKEKHSLPVISITMDEADLFDNQKGIYVKGSGASATFPYVGANFWQPWERCAHVEMFDGKDGFSYDCGIKIFGAFSRGREKKSFHIKFRKKYGESDIAYDLYNRGRKDEVSSFVLRSGSQDDVGTMVRDEFFTKLMTAECPTLHAQANRPVVLYLNGEYWGVYFIREKINEEFVANHLGVSSESVNLLFAKGASEFGTNTEYHALEDYARSHDLRQAEAYKYLESHIDFMSLIDYKIGEFYTGNCDIANIRFFNSTDKDCNHKWHWLFYDLDWGFYYFTPLNFYIRENMSRASGASLAPYNLFIDRLLRNPEFRRMFLERWAYHSSHTFETKHATEVFNSLVSAIEPEMERNCERWPQMSFKSWQNNVENFRTKIANRVPKLHENVLRELSVTQTEKEKYFK